MEIGSCARIPEPPVLDQLRSVYAAAFAEPPYEEPASAADDFLERLQRYATTRDGFRLVLAQRDDGSVIGFVLAALARPGDWWREQVAATLAPGDIQRRLGASCVEIVHVAGPPWAALARHRYDDDGCRPETGVGTPRHPRGESERPAGASPLRALRLEADLADVSPW